MKNKAVLSVSLLILFFSGFYLYKKYRIAPNIFTSKLNVVDANSNLFNFSILNGKAYVLTFYASWCADCLKEMPAIDAAISNELQGLPVYAVTDESIEKLNQFKSTHPYQFTYLKLEKEFKAYDIHAIPTTYIFDKNGQIIFSHVGYVDWHDKAFIEHIKQSTK